MIDLSHRPLPPGPAPLWAVVACLLWASAFAVIKIGLAYMPPLTFAGLRFTLAGALLLPLCGRPGKILPTVRRHWRLVLVVSLLQTVLLYGLFFEGMRLVQGAQAAVICGSAPLVCALLAHVFMHDDRMTPGKAGSITLGIAGVVILATASRPWQAAGLTELAGMGLLMGGVISSALAGIVVARNRRPVNPMLLAGAQMGLGGLVLLGVAMAVEGPPAAMPPGRFFAALVWLSAVSAAGFSIWFALLKRVRVSELNMWKFLLPLFGAALSWLILPTEQPTWTMAAGMVCVASAVLLTQLQAARAPRGAPPPVPPPVQ